MSVPPTENALSVSPSKDADGPAKASVSAGSQNLALLQMAVNRVLSGDYFIFIIIYYLAFVSLAAKTSPRECGVYMGADTRGVESRRRERGSRLWAKRGGDAVT